MKCLLLFLLMVIFGCGCNVQKTVGENGDKDLGERIPISFGNKLSHEGFDALPDDFAQKTPTWVQGDLNPPLAAAKAIELAVAKKKGLVKDTDNFVWELVGATLVPWGDGKWYWMVEFEYQIQAGGSTGIPAYLRLIVMMDGNVIALDDPQ